MFDNEIFQGSTTAPSAPGITVPYQPTAGRADRLSANIPGQVGAIANLGTRFTGGLGGSNQ